MHLSTNQTRALSDLMRLVANATDGDELRERMALPLLDLLRADTYVSMVWDGERQRFGRTAALNMSEESLRSWDDYFRFVDPLTYPMMQRRKPTLATQVLCQTDLSRTEFFNDFLRRDRMYWGVNVYFYDRERCVGDVRIWRNRERGNFDTGEIEILNLVEPAITAALSRLAWKETAPAREEDEPTEAILQREGRLSKREAEVAWLVSCGCPDKEIQSRLGLEYPTVRFHLGNAFKKLRVTNRAALVGRVRALLTHQEYGATATGIAMPLAPTEDAVAPSARHSTSAT
ncbi:helix-turn-helix transcriptional regulator [Variovorax beijingensis]|uniref:helix-turn-helix transcriptional regulator n=1 Tax=Variovorax beijingensis TaxID=2496117 RepID=UPI003F69B7B8